jgi:hypothetical protein
MMKHNNLWIVLIAIVAGLLLVGCTPKSETPEKVVPSQVEEIEGSELKRVTLTEKAAERLDLQTVAVREESIMKRRTVAGEVVAKRGNTAAKSNQLWVRVPFNETDMKMVARSQPARILSFAIDDEEDSDDEENGVSAEPDEVIGQDDGEDTALYYLVDSAKTGLISGQRVFVDVSLSESGELRMIVPYAALIYDADGGTWVYIKESNADALTFVRQAVTVDFIEGDLVVLTVGPPAGTEVVTVGGEELFGTETGVSK